MPDDLLRVRLETIEPIALAIVEQLSAYCERIEIAGSIRRRQPYIGDIEVLVVPSYRQQTVSLFDDLPTVPSEPPIDCLHEQLERLRLDGVVRKRPSNSGRTSWGPSDKRLLWRYGASWLEAIAVDVFGATLTTWGVKLVLRTGPWRFSKRLVTRVDKGGLLARDLEFRDGGLYRYAGVARRFVPTPDEQTLFAELGLPYLPPEQRQPTTYEHYWRSVAR